MDATTPPPWANVFANIRAEMEKKKPDWDVVWKGFLPAIRVALVVDTAFDVNTKQAYIDVFRLAGVQQTPGKIIESVNQLKSQIVSQFVGTHGSVRTSARSSRDSFRPYVKTTNDITKIDAFCELLVKIQGSARKSLATQDFILEVKRTLMNNLYSKSTLENLELAAFNDTYVKKELQQRLEKLNTMYDEGKIPIHLIEETVQMLK
jgi:hypothetical protein